MEQPCKCGRCVLDNCCGQNGAPVPFEGLELALLKVAHLRTLNSTQLVKWRQVRNTWQKIYALYEWLDPRHKGYIDVDDAILWLKRLWRLRELGCISDAGCDEAAKEHSTVCAKFVTVIRNRTTMGKVGLIELLTQLLGELPLWIGARAVVEKDVFLYTLWSLFSSNARLIRHAPAWFFAATADDPAINPLMLDKQSVIPAPDLRAASDFYAVPPEEELLPAPIPAENEIDKAERSRRNERERRWRDALDRCRDKHARQDASPVINMCKCGLSRCECPNSIYLLADRAKPSSPAHVDECLIFQYPILGSVARERASRPNVEDRWRQTLNQLLRDREVAR